MTVLENQLGTEKAMGEGEGSRAETPAHHVSISPQEDRSGTKGTVGEGTGCEEEGGLEVAGARLWGRPEGGVGVGLYAT